MKLAAVAPPTDLYEWRLAAGARAPMTRRPSIGFADSTEGTMPLAELKWARTCRERQGRRRRHRQGHPMRVQPGDVVIVANGDEKNAEGKDYPAGTYALRQIPEVSGALVAMDPHTGRVLALVGGWSYTQSEFNRATQALRQPGSSFKPIVYLAALDSGFTPSTVDPGCADHARPRGPACRDWSPENYGGDFLGPDDHARRHREVAQPDDRARRPGDRHAEGGRVRHEARRRRPSDAGSVDGARRRRDHAAPHDHRLFHDRQWRQADHADLHRPHPGPQRPDDLPP